MTRQLILVVMLIAGLLTGSVVLGQQHRRFDLVMKDIAAANANLKKNLDANTPATTAAAAEDAAKLEGLFKEAEDFWAPLGANDALNFAKAGRTAATQVAAAAKGSDVKAALAAYAKIGANCTGCHSAHREETAKGFLIKP